MANTGGLGVKIEVYDDIDPHTLLDVLPARFSPSSLEEIGSHGGGSFQISKNDSRILGNPDLIAYRRLVRVRTNGKVTGAFVIKTIKTTIVGAGEQADERWLISGEGVRSWSHDAEVYPWKGIKANSADTRYFNFASNRGIWYNSTDWHTPINQWKYLQSGNYWKTAPAQWPDVPNASWVWDANRGGKLHPTGYVYFRYEFTSTGDDIQHSIFTACDAQCDVYVDGELLTQMEFPAYAETARTDVTLNAGDHVVGIKAYNKRPLSPAGLLAAVFKYGDPDVPSSATLLSYTGQSSWKCIGYPTVEPGWTVGETLLTLRAEARDRGVRWPTNCVPTFTADLDSAGVPWAETVPWSFAIGTPLDEVISQMEDFGVDIWFDPDTLQFNAYKKRGVDRSVQGLPSHAFTTIRENLATDPRGLTPAQWTYVNGAISTVPGFDASSTALRHTRNASGIAQLGMKFPQSKWVAHTDYKVRLKVKSAVATTITPYLRMDISFSTAQTIGAPISVPVGESILEFTLTSNGTPVVPAAPYSGVLLAWPTAANGTTMEVTDYQIERLVTWDSSEPFFWGGVADQLYKRYDFSGANNASTTLMRVLEDSTAVIFQRGKNLLSADETGQADITNTMLVRTQDGWAVMEGVQEDAAENSRSKYGRIESNIAVDLTTGAAKTLVQQIFAQKAQPETSATFDIVPTKGCVPFVDFFVGDWVTAPAANNILVRRRIMSISVTERQDTGKPVYSIEFDTIFQDRQRQLERQMQRVSGNSGLGGGFASSATLPPTTVIIPGGATPVAIPDAPTGLTVLSEGRWTGGGASTSDFTLLWNPVISGEGYGELTVTGYEVWGRLETNSEPQLLTRTVEPLANLTGYTPNDTWVFQVRAISLTGGAGPFSAPVTAVADQPDPNMEPPSSPILSSKLGTVTVKWDGLMGGLPAPAYVKYLRVQRAPAFAGPWENIGAITGTSMTDASAQTGQTYFYRLVAVDSYDNFSFPSTPVSIVVTGVSSGDITGALPSNNLVFNGSFEDGLLGWYKKQGYPTGTDITVLTSAIAGAKSVRMTRGTETPGSEVALMLGQDQLRYIPVGSDPDGYFVSARAQALSGDAPGSFSIYIYWYTEDKITSAGEFSYAVSVRDLTAAPAVFAGKVIPPANAKFAQVVIVLEQPGHTIVVDDIVVRAVIGSGQLGENVVEAANLSAGSVTANALAAESVTANALAAGSVVADKIAAGEIQTNHLAAGVGEELDISSNTAINLVVSNIGQVADDLNDTNAQIEEIQTTFSLTAEGAILGRTDSVVKLALQNDRIEIQENGIPVTYWDSGQLVVDRLVGNEVVIGNHKLEKFGTGTVIRRI